MQTILPKSHLLATIDGGFLCSRTSENFHFHVKRRARDDAAKESRHIWQKWLASSLFKVKGENWAKVKIGFFTRTVFFQLIHHGEKGVPGGGGVIWLRNFFIEAWWVDWQSQEGGVTQIPLHRLRCGVGWLGWLLVSLAIFFIISRLIPSIQCKPIYSTIGLISSPPVSPILPLSPPVTLQPSHALAPLPTPHGTQVTEHRSLRRARKTAVLLRTDNKVMVPWGGGEYDGWVIFG